VNNDTPHFFFKFSSEPPNLDLLTMSLEPTSVRRNATRLEQTREAAPPEASPPAPECETEPRRLLTLTQRLQHRSVIHRGRLHLYELPDFATPPSPPLLDRILINAGESPPEPPEASPPEPLEAELLP
jgi:hypothetical protein